jgi:phosphoglucomutase
MEGLDGIEKRKKIMQSLRDSIPEQFGGIKVTEARDYKAGEIKKIYEETVVPTGLQPSDVLYYVLENGDKIVVRPSGTEPKIKIYLLAHADDKDVLEAKLEAYASDAKSVADV